MSNPCTIALSGSHRCGFDLGARNTDPCYQLRLRVYYAGAIGNNEIRNADLPKVGEFLKSMSEKIACRQGKSLKSLENIATKFCNTSTTAWIWEAVAIKCNVYFKDWFIMKPPAKFRLALAYDGITLMDISSKFETIKRYASFETTQPGSNSDFCYLDPFAENQWNYEEDYIGPNGVIKPSIHSLQTYQSLLDETGRGILILFDKLWFHSFVHYDASVPTSATSRYINIYDIVFQPVQIKRIDYLESLINRYRCNTTCYKQDVLAVPCYDEDGKPKTNDDFNDNEVYFKYVNHKGVQINITGKQIKDDALMDSFIDVKVTNPVPPPPPPPPPDCSKIIEELKNCQAQLKTTQDQLKTTQDQLTKAQADFKSANERLIQCNSDKKKLNDTIEFYKEAVAQLKITIANDVIKINTANARIASLNSDIENYKKKIDGLNNEITELKKKTTDCSDIEKKYKDLQEANTKNIELVTSLNKQIGKLQEDNKTLGDMLSIAKGFSDKYAILHNNLRKKNFDFTIETFLNNTAKQLFAKAYYVTVIETYNEHANDILTLNLPKIWDLMNIAGQNFGMPESRLIPWVNWVMLTASLFQTERLTPGAGFDSINIYDKFWSDEVTKGHVAFFKTIYSIYDPNNSPPRDPPSFKKYPNVIFWDWFNLNSLQKRYLQVQQSKGGGTQPDKEESTTSSTTSAEEDPEAQCKENEVIRFILWYAKQ